MGKTKQQLIDLINSKIFPNGKKQISGSSLNNVLTEMVNNSSDVKYVIYIDTPEIPLTSDEKAHNAEIFAICEQYAKNKSPFPTVLLGPSPSITVDVMGMNSIYFYPVVFGFGQEGELGDLLLFVTFSGEFAVQRDGSIIQEL